MTVHSLYPAFARVLYTVADFPHVMERQFHSYDAPVGGHPYGQTTRWDGVQEDADGTVEAFLTTLADLYTTDANFNSILFYTMASPTDEPILRAAKTIDIDGTMTINAGEEHLTVQVSFNFLDTDGGQSRVVLMEANSRNAYQRISAPSSLTVDEQTLVDYFISDDNIWASRDDARPVLWRARTATLNKKLRRARRYD